MVEKNLTLGQLSGKMDGQDPGPLYVGFDIDVKLVVGLGEMVQAQVEEGVLKSQVGEEKAVVVQLAEAAQDKDK